MIVLGSLLAGSLCFGQHVVLQLENLPKGTHADSVFVAGNFNGWQPGNMNYRFGTDGRLTIASEKGNILEFKFTMGNWQRVEVDDSGSDVANRMLIVNGDTTILISVQAWSNQFAKKSKRHTASTNVVMFDSSLLIPSLQRKRTVRLYLPPDYYSSGKRYPVLYLNDGQNVFDEFTAGYGEWKVDEALDSLYAATGKSLIVVAIDHGEKFRLTEYNPFDHERFGKGEGRQYADFVCKTLKPLIDNQFRTYKEPSFNWMAGSSMGGVISQYVAINYPDDIGGVGVFSPAFWTSPPLYDSATAYYHSDVSGIVYLYAGGLEGERMEADTRRMYNVVVSSPKVKASLQVDPLGKHNEATWAVWFHQFLAFMLKNLESANGEAGK